jgi:hypothetical protein
VVNTALFAEEPAPVDRDDEPIFASAATAVEPAKEDKAEEKIEGKPAEELKAEVSAPPVPVAVKEPEPAEAEEPTPSDVDLAEALRLLTPATGHAEVSAAPPPETLVAAGSRWVAEPMTLSAEEAAISLEAEMFRTFTATADAEVEPVRITGVKAIAAAVENRLAEAEMVASVKALAEPAAEHDSAEVGSANHGLVEFVAETTAAGASVVEAPAEVMAPVSEPAIPAVERAESEPKKEIKPEKIEAEPTSFPGKIAAEEEPAAATFADAVDRDEIEAAAEQNGEPVDEATAGSRNPDSNSEAEGQESMGTDGKTKSGKSNWHRIHTAPTSAAATGDAVEAAKQAECAAEQAPKAMAAAAEGSGSTSVTDARTIASIVDSVMADLRPKIVEEIAKKLAGK